MTLVNKTISVSGIQHLYVVFCVFTIPSQGSGWEFVFKGSRDENIYMLSGETQWRGEREKEGVINRVSVSGGGGISLELERNFL